MDEILIPDVGIAPFGLFQVTAFNCRVLSFHCYSCLSEFSFQRDHSRSDTDPPETPSRRRFTLQRKPTSEFTECVLGFELLYQSVTQPQLYLLLWLFFFPF